MWLVSAFILHGVFETCLFSCDLIESSGVNELCEEVFGKRQALLRHSQRGSETSIVHVVRICNTTRPVHTQSMHLVLDSIKAKFEFSVHIWLIWQYDCMIEWRVYNMNEMWMQNESCHKPILSYEQNWHGSLSRTFGALLNCTPIFQLDLSFSTPPGTTWMISKSGQTPQGPRGSRTFGRCLFGATVGRTRLGGWAMFYL